MELRKYRGANEEEARLQVKEELGLDALIVSVKQVKPKGLFRVFRKSFVEVTAARDDRTISKGLPSINLKVDDVLKNKALISDENGGSDLDEFKNFISRYSSKQKEHSEMIEETVKSIESSIVNSSIEEAVSDPSTDKSDRGVSYERKAQGLDKTNKKHEYASEETKLIDRGIIIKEESIEETPTLKLLYEQLLDNEVDEPYANELMNGLAEYIIDHEADVDEIVSIVYKRVVKNLSDYEILQTERKNKPVFFIGPTGVGKTTTIAKIASLHTLIHNRDVALITSDTYRIAAVEQLRTYANILGIPIKVVYTKDEMLEALEFFEDKDLVLIDTAGRSHKNTLHQNELQELLDSVADKEVFLTLSVATKYRDLMKIAKVYSQLCDFKVIFTKLDETLSYGNILNIKMATKAKLSYITFGQNVPDDISEINPHDIARNLLGGEDDGSSE